MALLKIYTFPDPVLKQPAAEVSVFDQQLWKLLDDMAETMYHANGVGLAANQVGVLQRVIVMDVSRDGRNRIELINPEITASSGKVDSEEGCLSVPDYRDTLKRFSEVTIRAQDRNGQSFELKADELLAICIQHELDHINGVLFVDRLSRLKKQLFKHWMKKRPANRPSHEEKGLEGP